MDTSRKSAFFAPAIAVTFAAAIPLRIVMEVNADGSVKPFYEQEEPSGMRIIQFETVS